MASRVVIGHGFCGKAGQYFWTGASRSSCPRSQSCMAAVAVSDLEMDARRKSVCSVAGALFSTSAKPKPLAHSYSPFSTTATESPGTWVVAMNLVTAASIWVRFWGESWDCWAWEDWTKVPQNRAATIIDFRIFRRPCENISFEVMSYVPTKAFIVGQRVAAEVVILSEAKDRCSPRGSAEVLRFAQDDRADLCCELSGRHAILLRDCCLIAHGLPVAGAADPDSGVAVGTAEVFSELMALNVGPSGHDCHVAIDANHHVAHVDGVVAKLAAFAGRDRVLLCGDLSKRSNRYVVLSEGALGEIGVAADAGFLGLPLHFHNLPNRRLVGGIDGSPRMHRDMLARKGRQCGKQNRRQQ